MMREPDVDEQTLRVKDPLQVAKRRAEHEGADGVPAAIDRTLDGGYVVEWRTEDVEDGERIETVHRVTYREPRVLEGS